MAVDFLRSILIDDAINDYSGQYVYKAKGRV
jgi:hypothetical protein